MSSSLCLRSQCWIVLVSVFSVIMGVVAVKNDVAAMILTGFAGSVPGSSSMAIGEFVFVYSHR